jgi:hypothetical protein
VARTFILPPETIMPPTALGLGMGLWVACNHCRGLFDAEAMAGLVRCGACMDRMAFRLPGAGPRRVVVEA